MDITFLNLLRFLEYPHSKLHRCMYSCKNPELKAIVKLRMQSRTVLNKISNFLFIRNNIRPIIAPEGDE